MRLSAPAILPLLRSNVQGEVLALTYLNPTNEYTLTEIASRIGSSIKTVHQEADRLVQAGLLSERRIGRNRLLRRGEPTALTGPLTDLMAVTYGPLPVLESILTDINSIEEAYIYGSWAARHQDVQGIPPHDIDVIVVGTVPLSELDSVSERAEKILHREVNIRRVSPERWNSSEDDPFLNTVKKQPLVSLCIRGSANA